MTSSKHWSSPNYRCGWRIRLDCGTIQDWRWGILDTKWNTICSHRRSDCGVTPDRKAGVISVHLGPNRTRTTRICAECNRFACTVHSNFRRVTETCCAECVNAIFFIPAQFYIKLLGVRAIARNTYCFCSVFFFSSPSSSPDRLSTKKHILANFTRTWNLACT